MDLTRKKSIERNAKRTGWGVAALSGGILLWNAARARAKPQTLEQRVTSGAN